MSGRSGRTTRIRRSSGRRRGRRWGRSFITGCRGRGARTWSVPAISGRGRSSFPRSITCSTSCRRFRAGAVSGRVIEIHGTVTDGKGAPLPDAMIEIWQANAAGQYGGEASFVGFGRSSTSKAGEYRFRTIFPGRVAGPAGHLQAPHVAVGVFGRGLIKRLVTRLYFAGEASNDEDTILALVPPERRSTLLARREGGGGGDASVVPLRHRAPGRARARDGLLRALMATSFMNLLSELLGDPEMESFFDDDAQLRGLLGFEAALARAEAATAVIPAAAGKTIAAGVRGDEPRGVARRARRRRGALGEPGHSAGRGAHARGGSERCGGGALGALGGRRARTRSIPVSCSSCAGRRHGSTRSSRLFERSLATMVRAHRKTLLAGRSWLQHALPTSFGLKVAGWLDGVHRDRERLARAASAAHGGAARRRSGDAGFAGRIGRGGGASAGPRPRSRARRHHLARAARSPGRTSAARWGSSAAPWGSSRAT